MLSAASELKYTREVKRIFGELLLNPTEDFVRIFASQVYSGRMTQKVLEQFTMRDTKSYCGILLDDTTASRSVGCTSTGRAGT